MTAHYRTDGLIYDRHVNWLMDWLLAPGGASLPRLSEIGDLCRPKTDGYGIHTCLRMLRRSGRITWRSGMVAHNRGHQAIRLKNGKVLKTIGCPFDPPEWDGTDG